jgi:predicted GNAT family acetyltransferase
MTDVTISRHDHGKSGEYRAHVEGSDHIGRLTWEARGDVRRATHTIVPPPIGGRGVAARLVEAMIEDARSEGFKIDPVCSYVEAAFRRHPEWAELRA